mgnify:CR=1 FL=1
MSGILSGFEQTVVSVSAAINSAMNVIFTRYYLRPLNVRQFSRLIPTFITAFDRALRFSEYFAKENLSKPKKSKDSVSWEELGLVLHFSKNVMAHVVLAFQLKINCYEDLPSQQTVLLFPMIILRFLKRYDSVKLIRAVAYQNTEHCGFSTVWISHIRSLNDLQCYRPWNLVWCDTEAGIERSYAHTHIWIPGYDNILVPTFKEFCFMFSILIRGPLPQWSQT